MKLAAIATIIATSFAALVAADAPCDAKLTSTLTAAATTQAKCKTDSGFDITAATVASADVLAKFCKSESCVSLWKTVKALGLSECIINDKHLNKEILNPAVAACPALGTTAVDSDDDSHDMAAMNSTTTMTTKAPTSNSTTPAATTKAPSAGNSTATSTKAPTASNSTSGNSTSSNSTTAKTPAPTTKAPTPTTSGVSALAVSASAVVITVATAFF